jgi:hypothetical protein|nr:MAG TPA: DNA-directed RNA polymerase subunit alpha [Caudoviricetes sp.]
MLNNYQNYYMFADLVRTGRFYLRTSNITSSNWQEYYDGILNILKDNIETEEIKHFVITVDFGNNDVVDLTIFDLYFNIIMWYLVVKSGITLDARALFCPKIINRKCIKKYFDKYIPIIVEKFSHIYKHDVKRITISLNNIIDDTLSKFSDVDSFSFFLANTINLKDTVDLMNNIPEFNDLVHTSLINEKIEDVKDIGMEKADRSIEIIKNAKSVLGYDHCLKNSFETGEGVSPRQYKEFAIHIGSKPDGTGGVHPHIIDRSYLMGGLQHVADQFVDSASSRVAQIIVKHNTSSSGNFARIMGINNIDTVLNSDLDYKCNTHNPIVITIDNSKILSMLTGRYYRTNPDGIDYLIHPEDTFLIGKTIYLFSPMTCASAAHGHGICKRCYGELAYINSNLKVGKFAVEQLTSQTTQKQLSAKHLLETVIEKINWNDNFNKFFYVDNVNMIYINDNIDAGHIIIDPNSIMDNTENTESDSDEEDNMESSFSDSSQFTNYITSFIFEDTNGKKYDIHSENMTEMFFSEDFIDYLKGLSLASDRMYHIDIEDLINALNDNALFYIQIINNDIDKNLKDIESLINKKDELIGLDKDSLLKKFINLIIKGKITIQSVHLECMLMNQIRSVHSKLELPEWEHDNEEYQILSLDQSLTNNPSVIISLLYKNLKSTLTNPITYAKNESSRMDMFFMVQPQEFLSNEVKAPKKPEFITPIFKS